MTDYIEDTHEKLVKEFQEYCRLNDLLERKPSNYTARCAKSALFNVRALTRIRSREVTELGKSKPKPEKTSEQLNRMKKARESNSKVKDE